MKYFEDYSEDLLEKVFFKRPEYFSKDEKIEFLRLTLGAQLVTPMTNTKIAENIINKKYKDLITNVWDLEDGSGNIDRNLLISNLKYNLQVYNKEIEKQKIDVNQLPFIFIRVKDIEMLKEIETFSEELKYCNGIVIPKAESDTLEDYLKLISQINEKENIKVYAIPILESGNVIFQKEAMSNLFKIKEIVDKYEDMIINISTGGTDFSGKYGIRRKADSDIYSLRVVNSCLTNILNIFTFESEYMIAAPVWEYFNPKLDSKENIGLLKEIKMDKENGMYSKIAIHPTQLLLIQLSYAVEYEEYMDAIQIIEGNSKKVGVLKSQNNNKMNELNTHTLWANNIISRAKIFGVFNQNIFTENVLEDFIMERKDVYAK
jgi:citrate lyase beta subunit